MADRWVKLELDVNTFDAARFEKYIQRCRGAGIRMSTLTYGAGSPRHQTDDPPDSSSTR
ncbi:hypothetical protein AB0I10_34565 [Streptomyces sp. NPDC050636]|uniref:hypothetical protein n=1 Tax=Streptomyces sp. NPDC050636 TaxID=3154510 RepID=UPI0034270845